MALIDDIKRILDDLAPHGWGKLFEAHGLNILADDLFKALTDPLVDIDRTIVGFEDFASSADKGIEPGIPSHSLVFHALASPAVVDPTISKYPTLEMLDTIENFIYSLSKVSIKDLQNEHGSNLVIATLCYQYKVASKTPHRRYADFCYSRTGISRVGTAKPIYDEKRRSFWVSGQSDEINVFPARFGCFLAIERKLGLNNSVMDGPDMGTFLMPVHKLFNGTECLQQNGEWLNINLFSNENHLQQKLNKIHTAPQFAGGITPINIFDIEKPPFVQNSQDIKLVDSRQLNGSFLVIPPTDHLLVRTAFQVVNGKNELARFVRPSQLRFWENSSSHQILHGPERIAPEYVNVRFKVNKVDDEFELEDLNNIQVTPGDNQDLNFRRTLSDNTYEAAHFLDDCAEGAFKISTQELEFPSKPAYSIVAAPDFFPLIDQATIESFIGRIRRRFLNRAGHSEPLSAGRHMINPNIELNGRAFDAEEFNITAIYGSFVPASQNQKNSKDEFSVSYMTDAASNLFHPGWDVSQTREGNEVFIGAFGLGSPFPEDAKLCAALSSYWPAASPDTARAFNMGITIKPMTDEELGFHPNHPKVLDGSIFSEHGWDGEFGPFFELVNGSEVVNYINIQRSDYVTNSLNNKMRIDKVAQISTEEMIDRVNAYEECMGIPSLVGKTLVTLDKVTDWSRDTRFNLGGAGYSMVFAILEPDFIVDPNDPKRRRNKVLQKFEYHVDANTILWRIYMANTLSLPPFRKETRS